LTNISQIYDGTPKFATATTDPAGLNTVTISYSQGGSPVAAPTNVGSYAVLASLSNDNYKASDATGTLVINKAAATVALSNLTQTYTGNALTPSAAITPEGLAIIWTNAPQTNAGSYAVTATVNDANYEGSASGTFTINKATPAFVGLTEPTIVVGTPSTIINGKISAGTLFPPAGSAISVSFGGMTQYASTDAYGNFSAIFGTAGLSVGSYPVTYVYAGNDNFGRASTTTSSVYVRFKTSSLQEPYAPPPGRSFKVKSSIPLKWQFLNVNNVAMDSLAANPSIKIYTAGSCGGDNGTAITVEDPGSSGLRYDADTKTWHFNWKTSGQAASCYNIYIESSQSIDGAVAYPIQLTK
jgi:hypothetical protein